MYRSPVFNYMENKFEARVRDHRTITRTTRMKEGDVTIANQIAVLEVKFDFDVLDRLHEPSFVGIERKTSKGSTYLIYEITVPTPIHFQMLGMDVSMPSMLRKEYLNTIDTSWGKSDETWIDVVSVPTQYRMDIDEDEPRFSRSKLTPLIGSKAYLLSDDTVRKFLCVDNGISIGTLIGFDIPLTVSIDNIVRYHTGIFGFTGTGKSNLTSYLIREAAKSMYDLKIVIFDISGEYSIHLLDLLTLDGMIYSTEDFQNSPINFLNSQTIPETLEDMLTEDALLKKVQELFNQGKIQRISVTPPEVQMISIGFIISILQKVAESKGSGSASAIIAIQELYRYLTETGYDIDTDVRVMKREDREYLINILRGSLKNIHSMSALYKDLEALIDYINRAEEEVREERDAVSTLMDPERLASLLLSQRVPKVNIVYIPEPDKARYVVSRFIDRLFFLKKRSGTRRKVLIVLDEAQEFIPNRTNKDDYSDNSNRSVEALLRQGRKYRLHCWLSSQRIAHLNVNALQQLHSYFVSTLPRFYDRMVIADAFSLSYDILEKTTELETGQWLFVSYKATKQKNVPVFIKTQNNEDILLANLLI